MQRNMLQWKWRVAVLVLLAGCGRTGPEIAPVSGRVTLNGKPLTQASVCFTSSEGYASSAPLGPGGSFQLVSQYGKGIPFGDYHVTIVPRPGEGPVPMTPESQPRNSPANVIPSKYQHIDSSGLTAAVDAQHREFNFDLVE